jgi:hypothetical protein
VYSGATHGSVSLSPPLRQFGLMQFGMTTLFMLSSEEFLHTQNLIPLVISKVFFRVPNTLLLTAVVHQKLIKRRIEKLDTNKSKKAFHFTE